ncbi:MAG: hypothetical protein MI725_01880, partial [Pirellulales bacterium]|nr:hypothetical protein [Pirellulales bacterium]
MALKTYKSLRWRIWPQTYELLSQSKSLAKQIVSQSHALRGETDLSLRGRAADLQEARFGKTPSFEKKAVVAALALVNEALRRVKNAQYYKVQLMAGLALATGVFSEMKTGEGKTLVQALPAFLHAIQGRQAHVMTVNAYLAKRDF